MFIHLIRLYLRLYANKCPAEILKLILHNSRGPVSVAEYIPLHNVSIHNLEIKAARATEKQDASLSDKLVFLQCNVIAVRWLTGAPLSSMKLMPLLASSSYSSWSLVQKWFYLDWFFQVSLVKQGMIDPEHNPVKKGTVKGLSHGVPYRPSLKKNIMIIIVRETFLTNIDVNMWLWNANMSLRLLKYLTMLYSNTT